MFSFLENEELQFRNTVFQVHTDEGQSGALLSKHQATAIHQLHTCSPLRESYAYCFCNLYILIFNPNALKMSKNKAPRMFDDGIFKKLFVHLPILDAKFVCLQGGIIYKPAYILVLRRLILNSSQSCVKTLYTLYGLNSNKTYRA